MRSSADIDVAVIGAGVIGLSIAHSLILAGAGRVVVYDRGGIGAEASGVQPGGVRHQWSTRLNCLLVLESSAFYRELGERLMIENAPVLHPCGYVFLAHEHETLDRFEQDVSSQNALGIPSQLLMPEALATVVPDMRVDGLLGGAFCAEDGYFDRPQAVVEAFGEVVVRDGGSIEIQHVRHVVNDGAGWRLEFSDGLSATAEQVIVAAGYHSAALLATLGHDLPIEPHAKYLFFSDPIDEILLEPLVVAPDRHFAAKHLADGRVLASYLAAAGDPSEREQSWRQHIRECIDELLPRLTFVSLGMRVQGHYDVTPDYHPIVGPVDSEQGLWLAAGFSGHGFMIAPTIGRMVAEALTDGKHDPLLDALAADRFAGHRLEPELQVV
jgi:sarcosine oxidase subunit beta